MEPRTMGLKSIERPSTPRSLHTPMPHVTSSPVAMGAAASSAVETGNSDEPDHTVARHIPSADVESQGGSSRLRDNDPYNLTSGLKTEEEITAIQANTSRKRVLKLGRSDKVASFYQNQNETIERLLKSVEEHCAENEQAAGEDHLRYQIAVYASFIGNIVLAGVQLYGATSSGSLSLLTTAADAVFDPLSNATLLLSHRAIKRVDPRKFPSGKARLENIGNITFCFILASVSILLIAFSVQNLVTHKGDELLRFHLPSVIAVAVAFGTKLLLLFYCWGLKDKYSHIDILWQDHRNDLAINGFGLLTSIGGSKLRWWIDPAGSIFLAILLIFLWLRTAFSEFKLLVGVAASTEMQQLITYVCVTHSPDILGIDTVRVYHSGHRLIAEVDIVMDPDSTLRDTHDVAEELQFKLESMPDIERAYVHVDYETTHKPEHPIKKKQM
ncbi:cation efflux family-domain-containing protein [Xylariaceae sp. FL1019]|nr:cation efflux family-domain-containing protein [Xylariaceae sp. FL1019]